MLCYSVCSTPAVLRYQTVYLSITVTLASYRLLCHSNIHYCSLMCHALSQHHAACSCSLTCLALSQHATRRSSVLCLVQATLSCRSLNSTPSGLVVHPEHHWIAASPDGLVNDPSSPDTLGIVEFKNPYAQREKPLIEATKDKNFCLAFKNNCLSLKHTHQYYYQVQATMFCTKRKWCVYQSKALMCLALSQQHMLLLSHVHVPCFVLASRCSCSLICLALSQHHCSCSLMCLALSQHNAAHIPCLVSASRCSRLLDHVDRSAPHRGT